MRRSKDLIEDRLGVACRALRLPVGRRLGGRRPRGPRAVRLGRPRRVADQPGRRGSTPTGSAGCRSCAATAGSSSAPRSRAARRRGAGLPRARPRPLGAAVSTASAQGRWRGVAPRVAHVTTVDLTLRFLLLPQLRRAARRRLRRHGDQRPRAVGRGHSRPRASATSRGATPRARGTRGRRARVRRAGGDPPARALRPGPHAQPQAGGASAASRPASPGCPCVVNTVHGLYATPEDRLRRGLPVLAPEWLAARCSRPRAVPERARTSRGRAGCSWSRRRAALLLGNGIDLGRFDPAARPDESGCGAPGRARDPRGRAGRRDGRPDGGREGLPRAVRRGAPDRARPARDVRFLAVGDARPRQGGRASAEDEVGRGARTSCSPAGARTCATCWRVMDVFVLAVVARGHAPLRDRGRGHGPGAGPHRHPRLPRGGPPRPRGPPGPAPRPGRPGRGDLAPGRRPGPAPPPGQPRPGPAPWSASARRWWRSASFAITARCSTGSPRSMWRGAPAPPTATQERLCRTFC